MKIAVTGAAGFIGSNLIHNFLNTTNWSILGIDSLGSGSNLDSLLGIDLSRFSLVKHDLANANGLRELLEGCDAVIHLAAESHNDNSLRDPAPFLNSNIIGTYNLLEAVRELKIRLHHVSTDEVFGDLPLKSLGKFSELSSYAPSSPYSATKAASDHLVRAWIRSYDIAATISNCSNNYGPRQSVEKFIPRQITHIISGLMPKLYGSGENIRDWIHVDDHIEAIKLILIKGELGETYLIGTEGEMSNKAVLEMLLDIAGLPSNHLEFVVDRKGHDLRYAIDSSKIKRELGWSPRSRNFKQELELLFEWYESNTKWWLTDKERIEFSYRTAII